METQEKKQNKTNAKVDNVTQLMIHKDWFQVFATRHGIATEPNPKMS